jgi:hypothetical protein
MSKELYMACHEELVEEYMETHGCDWQTAYDRTSDAAYERMTDRLADMADNYRDRMKDGQ